MCHNIGTIWMALGDKRTQEMALEIRREMAEPGATSASVAKSRGISRRTLYRILGSLVSDDSTGTEIVRLRKRDRLNPAPVISRSDAVALIADRMATGSWGSDDFDHYRKLWIVRNLTMRDWVIEASTRVRASIDPHYLSALFVDSVRHLRYLAARAEREKKTGLAIEATSRAAMLIASVSRANRVRSVGASEQRLDTTEKLIAAGWTPPAPDGLPMPFVDDPNEGKDPNV